MYILQQHNSTACLCTGAKSVAENGDITEAAKFAIGITCSTLSRDDYAASTYDNMRSFLQCSSGVVPDTLPQPELAATLDMIAKSGGADIFYNSSWTTQLVQELTDIAGEGNIDITVEDFNEYEVIKEGRVIGSTFKDYKVYGVGPPASGSVLALLLNVMDGLELQQRDATTLFQLIEAFKIVCPEYLNIGDPAGNTAVDMAVESMLTPEVATAIRNEIKGYLASGTTSNYTTCYRNQSVSDGANSGLGGTIHLSVVDRRGNAVSLMSSINYFFGSLVYSKETGIAFNNELDDFDPPELTYSPNLPAASKRPRSSAVPTIIADANTRNVKLVAGASGGRRIPPSVLQTILGVLNFNQSLQTSIDGTRIYVTWSDSRNGNFTVQLENDREDFTTELYTELTQLREGENIQLITSRYRAVVQGVYVNDDELVFPYSDTRKFGIADGYRRRRSASLN